MRVGMRKSLLIVSLLLLTSCGIGGVGRTDNLDTFCQIARPIYVSQNDRLTDRTARDILTHNEVGARQCGWQPLR